MGTTYRLIWCAVCATENGIPLESWRGAEIAARWGLVGMPFTTCDHCLVRLERGQIAVAVSSYASPSDYAPWESELLSDLDVEPLVEGEENAVKRRRAIALGGRTAWAMRVAHLLAFLGGVVLGLAFVRWCDLVLLSAGLSIMLAGGITAFRAG